MRNWIFVFETPFDEISRLKLKMIKVYFLFVFVERKKNTYKQKYKKMIKQNTQVLEMFFVKNNQTTLPAFDGELVESTFNSLVIVEVM